MRHPEASCAAQRWAHLIREITDARKDRALRPDSRMSLIHQAYLRTYPEGEALVRFSESLESLVGAEIDQDIERRLRRGDHGLSWFVHIGVDYHPDECLKNALQHADVDSFVLPEKTFMEIRPKSVKMGYMNDWEEFFEQDAGI